MALSLALMMTAAPMLGAVSPAWAAGSMDVTATIPGQQPDIGNGGGGGYTPNPSRPKPELEKNPDGSTTEVIIKPDGTRVETTTRTDGTKVVEEIRKDGSRVTEETRKDGASSKTTTTAKGETETQVKLPAKVIQAAADKNEPLLLPMAPSKVPNDGSKAPAIKVDMGKEQQAVVKIPVAQADSGIVAVLVKPDGSREVVRKSVADETGLTLMVENGAVIELVNGASSFSDTDSHWGSQAIDFVSSRELFRGISAAEFAPDATMTRAMFATVLWRLEGEHSAAETSGFTDVPQGQWYTQAVSWAVENDIINGYGDRFAPDQPVTRQQLAVMMYRYGASLGLEQTADQSSDMFQDGNQVADWALEAMDWAVSTGLLGGKGNGILDPEGDATRAEVAAICQRMVGLLLK